MFKKLLILPFIVFVLIGCEYKVHKVYEIKTVNGKSIFLSCPEIDPNQSVFTYVYNRECYILEENNER